VSCLAGQYHILVPLYSRRSEQSLNSPRGTSRRHRRVPELKSPATARPVAGDLCRRPEKYPVLGVPGLYWANLGQNGQPGRE